MVIVLIPNTVKNILKKIENNGFEAYIVGGFVRDFLLLRNTNDIDIATNARPKDLMRIFGIPKNDSLYGSYHMLIKGLNFDITTYRREGEYENGKPVNVTYSNSLLEDAKRRDFTINAMYMNKNEELIDLLDGRKDLKNKVLRMIGNPSVRLKEDPTRILRAVRFASMYHLKLEKTLKTAIQKEKKNISNIPINKIRKELDVILLANGFPMLKKLGLLKELGINNNHLVYVADLAGLWAQIDTDLDYIKEKELKRMIKKIRNIINCGTINVLVLYKNGYYTTRVAASIMHFPIKVLEKMENSMIIKTRKDIDISVEEIKEISDLNKEDLGLLISEVEEKILLKKLNNDRESIIKYIEERR